MQQKLEQGQVQVAVINLADTVQYQHAHGKSHSQQHTLHFPNEITDVFSINILQ